MAIPAARLAPDHSDCPPPFGTAVFPCPGHYYVECPAGAECGYCGSPEPMPARPCVNCFHPWAEHQATGDRYWPDQCHHPVEGSYSDDTGYRCECGVFESREV